MATYRVTITQYVEKLATVIVEADSIADARRKALDEAPFVEAWDEGDNCLKPDVLEVMTDKDEPLWGRGDPE